MKRLSFKSAISHTQMKYEKAIDELKKADMGDDKFEHNEFKKTLAHIAFGLLENPTTEKL